MRLEGRELARPEPLRLLEPGLERSHGRRGQAVNAHPCVEVRMALLDQPGLAQAAQVSAHGGPVGARGRGELARGVRPQAEKIDDPPAMRVGEDGENAVESRLRRQGQPSILSPLAVSISSRETWRTVWPKLQTWPSGSRAE